MSEIETGAVATLEPVISRTVGDGEMHASLEDLGTWKRLWIEDVDGEALAVGADTDPVMVGRSDFYVVSARSLCLLMEKARALGPRVTE